MCSPWLPRWALVTRRHSCSRRGAVVAFLRPIRTFSAYTAPRRTPVAWVGDFLATPRTFTRFRPRQFQRSEGAASSTTWYYYRSVLGILPAFSCGLVRFHLEKIRVFRVVGWAFFLLPAFVPAFCLVPAWFESSGLSFLGRPPRVSSHSRGRRLLRALFTLCAC